MGQPAQGKRRGIAGRPVAAALALSMMPFAPAAAKTQPDPAKVDALFARYAGRDVPGCAVAASRDGRRVLDRAYGAADLEHGVANSASTIFEAGSVSKQFTAAAILLLAADGRLALTDDVRRFVPELPDHGHAITIEHLLSHTSGLRDWGEVAAIAGWPRGTRAYTPADVLDIARRQRSLNYRPGAEYSYTNTGYNLMALIVDRVSGKTLAHFTRDRLFVPLGMTSTSWRDDFRRVVKNRAIAYEAEQGSYVQAMPFEDAYGNGGLLTTVGDLLRWNDALSADRLGSGLASRLEDRASLTGGTPINYARGLFVQDHRGFREVSHGGATGGYRAWLGRYPQQRISIALLCNAGDANAASLARGVADMLLPAASAKPALGTFPLPLADQAGLYVNQRTGFPMRIAVADGRLRVDGGAPLAQLAPGRFRFGSGSLALRGPDVLVVTTGEGQTFEHRCTAAARPTPARLARLAGRYVSEEAGATYVVTVEKKELVMRLDRKPDVVFRLAPAYGDAFVAGNLLVRFYGSGAHPSALGIGSSRVRDLRFVRMR